MPRQLLLGFENYYANFAAQRNKVPPILFILGEFLGDFFSDKRIGTGASYIVLSIVEQRPCVFKKKNSTDRVYVI